MSQVEIRSDIMRKMREVDGLVTLLNADERDRAARFSVSDMQEFEWWERLAELVLMGKRKAQEVPSNIGPLFK